MIKERERKREKKNMSERNKWRLLLPEMRYRSLAALALPEGFYRTSAVPSFHEHTQHTHAHIQKYTTCTRTNTNTHDLRMTPFQFSLNNYAFCLCKVKNIDRVFFSLLMISSSSFSLFSSSFFQFSISFLKLHFLEKMALPKRKRG